MTAQPVRHELEPSVVRQFDALSVSEGRVEMGLSPTEQIELIGDMDAAITVSMDGRRKPPAPVRLERYVVGTHGNSEPIPAAGGVGLGPEIIESNARGWGY